MPNIKSAKKRVQVAKRNRARNLDILSALRTALRAAKEAIKAGDKAKATECQNLVHKLADKAVQKNVIHRKAGDRKKRRLAKLMKELDGSAAKK